MQRSVDIDSFIKLTEDFALALQTNDLESAKALDEQIISLVGTNDRACIMYVKVPPRPLMWYAANRAMMRLGMGRVEEAALSMIDAMETLYYSGFHDDIYFMLNSLAKNRGKHDIYTSPFETACDYLMMAILCQRSFCAISLSFFWRAKTIFTKLGHADIARFIEGLIYVQCQLVSEQYKAEDIDGADMFTSYANSNKNVNLVIPSPEEKRKLEWPEDSYDGNSNLSVEDKKKIYGPHKPRHETIEDNKLLTCHWPCFSYEDSIVYRRNNNKINKVPNLLEVMEMLCYEEEKYAIRCAQDKIATVLLGDAHDTDGGLEQIVNKDGRYLFFPKGIINDVYYRGQSKYFGECKPSLFRNKTKKDVFIERVKLCEFSILLQKHPSSGKFVEGFVGELRDGGTERHEMLIDEEALAQHYGVLTEYLDVTTDKWVAAFFACTDYKRVTGGARDCYVEHEGNDNGVLYIYYDKKRKKYNGDLHPVGLQPLSRPILQAGCVIKMRSNHDFNKLAHGIRFRHDKGCTSIIYWLFDQSMKIHPVETIELKAKKIIEEKKRFSYDAFQMVHKQYYKDVDDLKFAKMVKRYGLQMQNEPLVDFDPEELDEAKQEFVLQSWNLFRTVIRREIMTVELSDI